MNDNTQFSNSQQWSAWHKISFRFFFVFLTLQVLTETFMGNWFGSTLFIWNLGAKIFVPPCLWINNHVFHFKYVPDSWTTFSGALHTIRDIVYLLLACLVCVLWTAIDKKRANYNKLLYWFTQCLVIALSCVMFIYGVIKLIPVQMASPSFISLQKPVGSLSPFELIWTTFGYGKPYQVFTGFFELSGAILILFYRTRVAGLLIIVTVMVNVVVLNYTYQVGVLILSFYILLTGLFLLAPYAGPIIRFFFSKQPVTLPPYDYVPGRNFKTTLFKIIAGLLISTSFSLNIYSACTRYTKAENVNRLRQYSMVKNYVVNKDTLKLIDNDTTCWRVWGERITDGKRLVTITTMKPGVSKTYQVEQDTSQHTLTLNPFNQKDTTSLNFSYFDINKTSWRLEGLIRQKNIKVELQKINPDTTMNLLKTKRTIIIFDDESDSD